MTINYCTRTVRNTNEQLKTYKPITQRDLNVINVKLTLNKSKKTGLSEWAARISIGCFHLTTHSQLLNL